MYVNDLLAAAAREFGPRTALTDGVHDLTYAELLDTVVRYARRLRGLGLGRGSTVAVRIDRSLDTVPVFLATQWIGAAYLPIDDRLPVARVRFMLTDADCDGLILEDEAETPADAYDRPGMRVLTRSRLRRPDEHGDAAAGGTAGGPAEAPEQGGTAYVLYTSGSTGLPKAVPVSADNLSFFAEWLRRTYTAEEMRFAAFTISVGFDVSFAEILAPLVHGGTLVLYEDLFRMEGTAVPVTSVANVPGNFSRYLERCTLPPTLKVVTSLGEPLRADLARRLMTGQRRLINAYGPTETTIYTTHHEVTPEDLHGTHIPIGLPLDGVTAEVLAADGTPCAQGEPGELVITGPNVADGYLSPHARSSEAFFRTPGAAHPSYRTGDVVVRDASGVLTCLGRVDRQVKVNGIRVDLQEITSRLLAREGVANAHVCARPTAEGTRLVAFVIPEDGVALHASDIQGKLAGELPRYCVPHDVVTVSALPTTLSGKIDETALLSRLAEPEAGGTDDGDPVARLLEWCAGPSDGAGPSGVAGPGAPGVVLHALTSLQLIDLRRRLLHEHATDVPLRQIHRCRDAAELAGLLRRHWGNVGAARGDEPASDGECTVGEQNIWLADMMEPGSCGNNEVYRLSFTRPVPAERVAAALRECVRAFPALRTGYRLKGGRLVKEVADAHGVDLRLEEVPGSAPEEERDPGVFGRRPFDLAAPLKIRARYLPGERPVVLLTIHHIAIDAVAVDVLLEHLERVLLDRPGEQPDAGGPDWRRPVAPDEMRRYWRERLAGLDTAPPAPVPPGEACERRQARVSGPAYQMLRRATRSGRTSVFGMVHAALTTALGRQLGTGTVSLGTPVTGRVGHDRRVGCFTNLVPLVVPPRSEGTPAAAYLDRLRQDMLDGFEHSAVSLSDLRSLQGRPEAPLLHAMLAEVRKPGDRVRLFDAEEVFTGIAKLPLMFLFEEKEKDDSLTLVCEYVPTAESTAFAESVLADFVREIGALSADAEETTE